MNYDLTDKELAEHIYKEYGGMYDAEHLRGFARFFSALTEIALDCNYGDERKAYLRGAIDGMRYLAYISWQNTNPEDAVILAKCWDEITNEQGLDGLATLASKISKDKKVFPK